VSVVGDVDFEAMLTLGVTPVAAGTPHGLADEPFAPYLDTLAKDVRPLAWASGVPIDQIAKLHPDLIFAPDERTAEELSKIAPTVPRGSRVGADWKRDFRYVASVLGKDDEAAKLLSDWGQRVNKARATLGDAMDGRTVASPQATGDQTSVRVDSSTAFSSTVLHELGLQLAPEALGVRGDGGTVPLLRLDKLDADVLFWQVRSDSQGNRDTTALSVAKIDPLWPELKAVKANAVYEVDSRQWDSPTLLGAERILDDVEQALG